MSETEVPSKIEVKTAGGISLETPRLADITPEEGLKILTEPFQLTIAQIENQISTMKNWGQRRRLQKELNTYKGFLSFVNGRPVSSQTTAQFLMYATKEATDSRADAFAILTEGEINPLAPSRQPVDLEVDYDQNTFRSPEEMQVEYSDIVKQALVWENATLFIGNPSALSPTK